MCFPAAQKKEEEERKRLEEEAKAIQVFSFWRRRPVWITYFWLWFAQVGVHWSTVPLSTLTFRQDKIRNQKMLTNL